MVSLRTLWVGLPAGESSRAVEDVVDLLAEGHLAVFVHKMALRRTALCLAEKKIGTAKV